MSSGKKNWLILIVFALLIGVGTWYYYSNNQDKGSNGNFAQSKTPTTASAALKAPSQVTLSSGDFSFKAPTGWQKDSGGADGGPTFSDSKGNFIVVLEESSTGENGPDVISSANYVWVAHYADPGIIVDAKSSSCASDGKQLSFSGANYVCEALSSPGVDALVTSGDGHQIIHAGTHDYSFSVGNSDSTTADFSTIQSILETFKSS